MMVDFVGTGLPDDDDLPDSPAVGEGAPPDDDAADADPDSQADDVSDDDDATDTDDVSDDDDGTGDGASPTFEKLLSKYGGNREAMAQAFFDQANSLSDLTHEVRDIKEFIAGQQQTAAAPKVSEEEIKQRIADSSDVAEVSEELASIEEEIKSEQGSYSSLIQEVGKAEKAVARLEGKLEAAYDENKPAIASELASAQAKLDRLTDKFRDSDRSLKKLGATMRRTQRRMEKAEKSARSEIDKNIKQEREDASSAQEVRREFSTAMLAEAKERNLHPDSKEFKVLFDSVQSRLWKYTQSLPENAEPIDIPVAVKVLVEEYIEAGFGKGKSFQSKSTDKRKATTRTKDTPPRDDDSDRTPSRGAKPRTAADWDKRAQRLLGG